MRYSYYLSTCGQLLLVLCIYLQNGIFSICYSNDLSYSFLKIEPNKPIETDNRWCSDIADKNYLSAYYLDFSKTIGSYRGGIVANIDINDDYSDALGGIGEHNNTNTAKTINPSTSICGAYNDGYNSLACSELFIDNAVEDKDLLQDQFYAQNLQRAATYHLFSHGRPGELLIDGQWKNAQQIVDWLKAVEGTTQNTLLIYGCNFAQGHKGKVAVDYIEAATGLKVAASNDITGQDGDWELEVRRLMLNLRIERRICSKKRRFVTAYRKDILRRNQ